MDRKFTCPLETVSDGLTELYIDMMMNTMQWVGTLLMALRG